MSDLTSEPLGAGRVETRELDQEVRTSFLDYAMSVIVSRALPDVRDGLKPVHRRVLYAMHESGLQPNPPTRKGARGVGEVMGNYHPHGDQAIYDALVRLAQPFSLRYPLVDGQGYFGSVDGDPPGAMRYTECRLSRIATELLRDIDADTVDYEPNYDEPSINVEKLMKHIKAPDFPTGGTIVGYSGVRDAYRTGRGRITVRGRAHIEQLRGGKSAIIITELPYGVRKAGEGGVIEKIADLVKAGTLTEVPMSDDALQDHSDKEGMRIYVELKRDAVPRTLSLLELVGHYLDYQREIVTRRSKYELRQAERRAHVLEGYLKALDNLDAVIDLIRNAADPDEARTGPIEQFELSEIQAQAILDLRLSRLTRLARKEIEDEYADLQERIAELRGILGDPARVDGVVKEELLEIRDIYGKRDDRRTEIVHAESELELEDLIAEEDMVIAITRSNYIK